MIFLTRELKQIKSDYAKFSGWPNKNPWLNRIKNTNKGIYLPLSCKLNMKLLKIALSFAEYQMKLRTEILTENSTEKWFIRSRQVKNIFEVLTTLSSYNLPYDPITIKKFSVFS